MTLIPVDPEEINERPKYKPLDESLTYRVSLRTIDSTPKMDKNGDSYIRLSVEVVDGEFKGRRIFDNYIRLPQSASETEHRLGRKPSMAEIQEGKDKGDRFKAMVKCFSIPSSARGVDPEQGIGREGMVNITNENYPPGSPEIRSRVRDYMVKK